MSATDPDTPATYIATRAAVAALAFVLVGTVAFGDPLSVSILYGLAAGGLFGTSSYLLRRVLDS